MEQNACPTCGSCAGMFTANSMNCLLEILGLALPGNGTILAVSDERRELVRESAKHLMDLVKKQIKPRDIVTKDAIDDAFALDMAMGGSTNTVLHTLAIATKQRLITINPISMRLQKSSLPFKKSRRLPIIRCTMFMRQVVFQQLSMNWSPLTERFILIESQ